MTTPANVMSLGQGMRGRKGLPLIRDGQRYDVMECERWNGKVLGSLQGKGSGGGCKRSSKWGVGRQGSWG